MNELMKNNPCDGCTAGEWGFCYHQEYGPCAHAKYKTIMKKTYDILELQKMDFFQLIAVAEKLQVENYEHLAGQELIYAILDKQYKILTKKEAV